MKNYAGSTQKEMSDSGQALVLISLILFLFLEQRVWLWLALACLVLNMACPSLFRWWAFLWLNVSLLLGGVVSRIVMTLEFFLLVLPVGLVRRLMGRDAMALKQWRRGSESVFVERDHVYVAGDLENPY